MDKLSIHTGNILNRYEYDAFGNTVMCEESGSKRFRFTGQQYDFITEQYYLRARYYNPVIGRFIQEDTYYGDGLNLYAYCENNPIRYVDPSGYTKVDAFEKPGGNQQAHSTGNEPKRMTWNEFQHANKGKYTKAEMSAAWADYKKSFAQSVPNSTPSQGSNNPYDLLKKRGIHTTLSDAEIDAANAVDLRMQAQGGSDTNTKTFYQVTSKENAKNIEETGKLIGKEFKEVYAWTEQPTLKQAKNSGARDIETVISFEANPNIFPKMKRLQRIYKAQQGLVLGQDQLL